MHNVILSPQWARLLLASLYTMHAEAYLGYKLQYSSTSAEQSRTAYSITPAASNTQLNVHLLDILVINVLYSSCCVCKQALISVNRWQTVTVTVILWFTSMETHCSCTTITCIICVPVVRSSDSQIHDNQLRREGRPDIGAFLLASCKALTTAAGVEQ
eukprot:14820-Heterococcus_DN1.PRE.9